MDELRKEIEVLKAINKVIVAQQVAIMVVVGKKSAEETVMRFRFHALTLAREALKVQAGTEDDLLLQKAVNSILDEMELN